MQRIKEGEKEFMNAKEKMAIALLNRGMGINEVAQKTRLSKVWLQLQKERTV